MARWLKLVIMPLALLSQGHAVRDRPSDIIPGGDRGRHGDRALNALRAWFNGAANNFVLTQRDAGVRLTDIIKAVVDSDGAQSSAANQPPLDLTAVRVTRFLNEQPADRVLLVHDHRLSAKRQYQVVPPKVKQMPVDRHRNSVAVGPHSRG